ncbi:MULTISPECIES: type II toxin-antitoxin system VapC family toxin [Saccharibacillus]|uniref:type II toxin-antitoxin system VapC family toxin n=1 Tax=Saccharibacillus TaxID=456492 RepID=UPI00131176F2|nr:PIN domain-containing protein [Saccharibacillus sp. WB 17]MWJ31577.1 PIN domain-containing protein [Saccharibacillus sp. WB 17]
MNYLFDTNAAIELSKVYKEPDENEEAEEFLSVTPIIAKTAGNLRDKLSTMDQPIKIKMPDALILATAITHDLVLVTADADFRFSKIMGVETFIFKPAAGIEGI